jgi:molybdopterin synthase catalytic subunit
MIHVSIGKRKISLEKIIAKSPETSGACAIFIGVVRGREKGKTVSTLEYTDYREMALVELRKIAVHAAEKYALDALYVHHRVGKFKPGEPTVYIVAFAPHRDAAFDACKYVIEMIKKTVPIWKKEYRTDGSAEWK